MMILLMRWELFTLKNQMTITLFQEIQYTSSTPEIMKCHYKKLKKNNLL